MSGTDGARVLMKGNEAIAEAAIRAGCRAYFGYPITPQNEIIAYMAKAMMEAGGVFIQAESEIAAVSMCFGASAAGARAMTSSSSPGISLKQEGISYAAGADIPLVVVNVARGGPGLGSISPAQSDYFQATRGGGHGDYRIIVLAPKSVQECADLTTLAFALADRYRMPAMVLADGIIGQMMEAVVLPEPQDPAKLPPRDWTVGGMALPPAAAPRPARHITSLDLVPAELERKTRERFARYDALAAEETRFEETGCAGADVIIVAYGTSARVAQGAREIALAQAAKGGLAAGGGLNIGIFRPVTLFPFPKKALGKLAAKGTPILVVEMSLGQLVEDVKLAVYDEAGGARPVIRLVGHSGGVIPTEEEVFAEAAALARDAANGNRGNT